MSYVIYNRGGNVAYEKNTLPGVENVAVFHDAHITGNRIVDSFDGRTLFTFEAVAE